MKGLLRSVAYVMMLILTYLTFQIVFTFIAMIVAMVYASLKGYVSIVSLEELIRYEVLLSSPVMNNVYMWAMSIALFLSTVAMLLFIHFIKGYRLKLSLFSSISSRSLSYSTMLVFSSMFAFNIFVQWLGLNDNLSDEFNGLAHNVIGILTISLLAPLLEEVLFRGAIQGHLMRRYNPWVGIISAALVFGIIHMNPVQTVYATLVGLVFGWIYYRTGSLLSVIFGHVLNNSMGVVSLLLLPEGEALSLPDDSALSVVQVASEVFLFALFVMLSLLFAVKLHRTQPPVPSPWHDATDDV